MSGMVLLLSVLLCLGGLPGTPIEPAFRVRSSALPTSAGLLAGGGSSWAGAVGGPIVGPVGGPVGGPVVGPVGGAFVFGWPVVGARVVRVFDPPPRPWLPGHRGADLAAAPGAEVRAAGAGTIVFAGEIAGRGVVSVAHPGGLRTTYEPVLAPARRPGEAVAAGEVIGTLSAGHPGCPAPACLHWGLRRGADYLDPLTLLGLGRVRLLPL